VNVALSRALRALERMNVLIGDLMDASHPRTDLFVTRRARCDLTTVVREAVEELPELAPRQVRLDIAPEPLLCDADAGRISQVVHNYLSNALKYAPEQSPIEVGVRSEGGKARLWVRDGGPGIPLEDQPRIWERFYRVEGIPHQPGTRAGLGLGLYISRAIVEQHGGEVGVESGAGGSTFWFTIPLAETVS
jgi:signal transduction histidine kinase